MAVTQLGEPAQGAGFDQPFELLEACHERVERYLALLGKLVTHLRRGGLTAGQPVDTAARDAAIDVRRYFNMAAPLHHEDEERHVFPLLQSLHDATLDAAVARLRSDHLAFHERWIALDAALQPVAEAGRLDVTLDDLADRASAFASGYAAHIACEHEQVFPAARLLLAERGAAGAGALREMGADMARRRGVKPPEAS